MEKSGQDTLFASAAPRPPRRFSGVVWKSWLNWMVIILCSYLTLQKIYLTVVEALNGPLQDHHPLHKHTHPSLGEQKGLEWEPCGTVNGRKLECTRLDVPMDQFNATNSGDKVFNLPVVRMLGDHGAKNILINPGGPGGSGHEFIYRFGERLSTIIGPAYHLVGFDPRGVNGSRPQALCYPDAETRRSLSDNRIPSRLVEDSPHRYAYSKSYVKACVDVTGEHGKYINTPQTAADMNTIMDALGQEEMIYWGFSYGTLLGQTYATMFPERSHRIMIEAVVDVFSWYNDVLAGPNGGLRDTDRVVRGFFEECAKAGADCPLTTHGKTADELENKIHRFIGQLADQPLGVYVNTTSWGTITADNIITTALFSAAYKPAIWWTLADRLSKLLSGNATEAYLVYGDHVSWFAPEDDSNVFVRNNDQPSGPKNFPHTREEALEMALPVFNTTIFMGSWLVDLHDIQHWAIPKTHTFRPKRGVKTKHPLFISSNTYDPVTPLMHAKGAQQAFVGSGLVEVKAFGHGSIANPSNCYAKHVRAFLYNGTIPKGHVTCEIDGGYFKKPEEQLAAVSFADEDDQAIYRAQVEMARDESWPVAQPGSF